MIQRLRIPAHLGLIPDGNRRWAEARGLAKEHGYAAGVEPGLRLLDDCRSLGVREVTIYGFTQENVRRAARQVAAFRAACVEFALAASARGAALLVVGDSRSRTFPRELVPFAHERGEGDLRVNLLVNYGWRWDLFEGARGAAPRLRYASHAIPRVDLVVRWGGRQRLSGFLPLQSAYADLFVIPTLWPDMSPSDLETALAWYRRQDVTIGG